MSPLALIPAPYRVAVVAGLLAACVGLGFAGGWAVNGWRLGSAVAEAKAAHDRDKTQALAKTVAQRDAAIATRDRLAGQLATIDADGSETLRRLKRENETLRDRVGTGAASVRVRGAVCPAARAADVPQAPAGSGVDSGGGAVLGVEAGQIAVDIRHDAGRIASKLNACQAALGCMTGQRACPPAPP